MEFLNPKLSFDGNKPFYPLVINCIMQIHGFIELASRGVKTKLEQLNSDSLEGNDKEAWVAVYKGGRTGLFGKQQLESKATGQGISIDIDLLANEVFEKHESPGRNARKVVLPQSR